MSRTEICGNIASGKTTLCQVLSKNKFLPIFEDFQTNPFFEDFYNDPKEYSFETEITFLLQHYHQIKKNKNNPPILCDYSLLLDMAYADVNLSGNRLKVFFDVVGELQQEIGLPDRIIHLVCPEEVLLQRIIDRNREVETSITIEYLKALSNAISARVKDFSSQTLIIMIDSHAVDFTSGFHGLGKLDLLV
jgi:deoxyadenosine/deoxycytidine kinase